MPGLVPGIHVFTAFNSTKTWMTGNSPAMTKKRVIFARSEKLLPLCLAAAGGFGLFDRAEPARALADFHLDLGVPAAGGLVVDAFAGPVDVALDGAVGRGRDRPRG